jgi:hypothetical protein
MPSSPPFLCQCVPLCTCLAVTKGHFEKKGLGMPSPCVHASPCAVHRPRRMPCVCPMRMSLKGQEGWSKMTQTSGSSRPHRGAFSTVVTDSNEQKPTVTAAVSGGLWRPGAEDGRWRCARSFRRARRAGIGVNRARKKRKNREKPRKRYGATPVRRSPAAARYVYTRRIYATLRYAAYGPANPIYHCVHPLPWL